MNYKLILFLFIFNTFTNIIIIAFGYQSYFSRIEFNWRETFWMKKKYGLDIFLWDHPINICPNQGRSIFGFNFMSAQIANAGDYEKYQIRETNH
jgi:hypothetical protein